MVGLIHFNFNVIFPSMNTLIIKFSYFLLRLFLIGAGYKKEDKLPLASQEGLNTLGMLVNGQIWRTNSPITLDGDL